MDRLLSSRVRWVALFGVLLGTACGGGGGGGGGPPGPLGPVAVGEGGVNDLVTDAGVVLLASGEAGNGTVGPGDVADFWRITPGLGQFLEIEVQAVRRDQAAWAAAGASPRLQLVGPGPIYPLLLDHDPALSSFNARDLDIVCYRVTLAGDHFVCVRNSGTGAAAYVVTARVVVPLQPVQLESEPNDTAVTADPIVPGTMYATYTDNELDHYSFTLAQESEVCFEVIGQRNGINATISAAYLDPEIEILTAAGAPFAPQVKNDDTFNRDSGLCERLPAGSYVLQMREFSGTTASGEYCLRFTRRDVPGAVTEDDGGHPILPHNDTLAEADSNPYGFSARGTADSFDVDFYRFFGTAGDIVVAQWYDLTNSQAAAAEVDVRFTDSVGVLLPSATPITNLQAQRTILRTTGDHYVRVTGLAGPTDYHFHLQRVGTALLESEPNDSAATADDLSQNHRASGAIDPSPDVDFYRFTAVAGEVVTVDVFASSGFYDPTYDEFDDYGSTLMPQLVIHDGVGPIVPPALVTTTPPGGFGFASAQSLADGLPTIAVTFVAPADGTYFVEVRSEPPAAGGVDARYVIERR